ncbi:MAG TPA: Maf family protein [Baekduia sp.]|nr:Maf family protein [Baekduia sp.]
MPRLILASGSPQRRAILGDLGLDFEVRVSDVAEQDAGAPRAVASENARRKALAVAGDGADELVIGCDTLVATGDQIWGKPPDEAAARDTLRHLAGRTHEVVSGLALAHDGEVREATEITLVTFRELDEPTIDWYLTTREWEGRAGGYAIQGRGAVLVSRIEGDYLNVVGLPVAALLALQPQLQRDFAAGAR